MGTESLNPLAEFESKKKQLLQEKDLESQKLKEKMLSEAQNYKQQLLQNRLEKKEKKLQQNKENESIFKSLNETKHENIWEDVMKFVDIKQTNKDVYTENINRSPTRRHKLGNEIHAATEEDLKEMDDMIFGRKKKRQSTTSPTLSGRSNKSNGSKRVVDKLIDVKDTNRLRKLMLELKVQPPLKI